MRQKGVAMTFKDKRKEIVDWLKQYTDYIFFIDDEEINLSNGFKNHGIARLKIRNNLNLSILSSLDREFNFTNSSFLNKKEIKFIYDFIEFLESLGFKEGE